MLGVLGKKMSILHLKNSSIWLISETRPAGLLTQWNYKISFLLDYNTVFVKVVYML